MFHKQDKKRESFMLTGPFAYQGYDWWWHSFTAIHEESGEEKPFFIEYYLCNPALGGKEPILGQLPENKKAKKKPSYLMVKAGCWGEEHMQLHRFIGWDHVILNQPEEASLYSYAKRYKKKGFFRKKESSFSIKAHDCYVDSHRMLGKIEISREECQAHPEWMCDAGSMEWNLQVDKKIAFNVGYGASTLFRFLKAFEMYWHAEGMKTEYSGSILLNGERYLVKPESSYGYADKNWGRNFTSPWLWLSSNCMKSRITGQVLKNSVFDIGGGRPKVFFLPLDRKLLGAFWYEGKEYEYNFSKIWMAPSTRFQCRETDKEIQWHVIQENRHSLMETMVTCQKKDMLLVNYEAPDGKKRHNRLWNGGNGIGRIRLYDKKEKGLSLIDDIEVSHIGCEYGEYTC